MPDLTPPADRIDPSVSVPAAVRAQAARATELHKATFAPGETSPKDPPKDPAAPPVTPAPAAKEAPITPRPVDPAGDGWEHKYNSMKGRYDQSAAQQQQLSTEISNLHRLIAEMESAPHAPQQQTNAPQRFVSPEEENDFGKEFLDVVGKRAKEEFVTEISSLKAQIEGLTRQLQGVAGTVTHDARTKMYVVLDANVPQWKELNNDPEFNSWLDLPDTFSGAIRRNLLNAAYERHDANRVAAFFKGFVSNEAAPTPATAGQATEVTSAGNPPTQDSKRPGLEQFAAPGRAKTAAAASSGTPVEKPTITRAQVSQFYADVTAGKYRDDPALKKQRETEIFTAQGEGRIR